jgi:hypothetical protein
MRQLLATIVLGGVLAVTASVAFAGDNQGSVTEPAFTTVATDIPANDVSLSGANTQQNWFNIYRSENIGQ